MEKVCVIQVRNLGPDYLRNKKDKINLKAELSFKEELRIPESRKLTEELWEGEHESRPENK